MSWQKKKKHCMGKYCVCLLYIYVLKRKETALGFSLWKESTKLSLGTEWTNLIQNAFIYFRLLILDPLNHSSDLPLPQDAGR